jgi:hypothetical protein
MDSPFSHYPRSTPSGNAARRASAILKIASEHYTPEEISSFIGLKPDESWRTGEAPRRGGASKHSHAWIIESVAEPFAPLELHIERLLERINHIVSRIRALGSQCTVTLLGSTHTDSSLVIDLRPHLVAAIDEISAILGIDIYALLGEERLHPAESDEPRLFQRTRAELISIGIPGVEPSLTGKWLTSPRQAARAIRHLLWGRRSRGKEEPQHTKYTNQPADDADVEAHIAYLLRDMPSHKSLGSSRLDVRVWCSILTNTRAILMLEPMLVGRIARIGAGLTIDYFLNPSLSEQFESPISR